LTGRPFAGEGFMKMLERMLQRGLMPKPPARPRKEASENMGSVPIFSPIVLDDFLKELPQGW